MKLQPLVSRGCCNPLIIQHPWSFVTSTVGYVRMNNTTDSQKWRQNSLLVAVCSIGHMPHHLLVNWWDMKSYFLSFWLSSYHTDVHSRVNVSTSLGFLLDIWCNKMGPIVSWLTAETDVWGGDVWSIFVHSLWFVLTHLIHCCQE